jgi:lysophospholipase L1-like esterase
MLSPTDVHPRHRMNAPLRSARPIAKGLAASLVALAALAGVEMLLRLLPSNRASFTHATFLDRQGGLEEIEQAVVEEMGAESEEALRANRIYRDDEETFWRLRAGVTITGQNYLAPRSVREREPFTMTTNPDGFRGPAIPIARGPDALRVVAVGNSSTFGWGVNDDETYPQHLARRLAQLYLGRAVDVMNAGVPGFTTFQGGRILAAEVLPRRPDFIVLSFGFNDSRPAASSDSAFAVQRRARVARMARAMGRFAIYRSLERLLRRGETGDRLSPGPAERVTVRVPAPEFAMRLRAMVRAARAADAQPILLAMAIPKPYRDAIATISREESVPFLDTTPYLLARIADDDVRATHAGAFARHEAAWRDVPRERWRSAAYADAIHPSGIGHDLIAEWIARVIENADLLASGKTRPGR